MAPQLTHSRPSEGDKERQRACLMYKVTGESQRAGAHQAAVGLSPGCLRGRLLVPALGRKEGPGGGFPPAGEKFRE